MDAPGLSPACLSDLSSSPIWVSMLQSLARAFHLTPPSGERREISLRHDKVRFVFYIRKSQSSNPAPAVALLVAANTDLREFLIVSIQVGSGSSFLSATRWAAARFAADALRLHA